MLPGGVVTALVDLASGKEAEMIQMIQTWACTPRVGYLDSPLVPDAILAVQWNCFILLVFRPVQFSRLFMSGEHRRVPGY